MKTTEYTNHTSENTLRKFTMKRTTLIKGGVLGAVRSTHSTKISILFQLEGGVTGGVRSTHYTKVSICFN
jgi:hypothetical protein